MWGGKDWPPAAYNPKTGYVYIPANENLCGALTGKPATYPPGQLYMGVDFSDVELILHEEAKDHIGELQAWDMNAGKKVWTATFKHHNWGPVLTTGGGLVFTGGTNDRYFRACDAQTGKVLWQQRTNSGVTGVPSSYQTEALALIFSVASSDDNGFQACCARVRAGRDVQRPSQAWAFAALDKLRLATGASMRTDATFKSATVKVSPNK